MFFSVFLQKKLYRSTMHNSYSSLFYEKICTVLQLYIFLFFIFFYKVIFLTPTCQTNHEYVDEMIVYNSSYLKSHKQSAMLLLFYLRPYFL